MQRIGPQSDGRQYRMNLQPVVPFTLNADWNRITRTIVPVVDPSDIFPGAGSGRPDIHASFLRPVMCCTTPSAWSFTLQAEATCDWERDEVSVPVGACVGKVLRLGQLQMQVSGGPCHHVAHFDNGPRGWDARPAVTFILPR